MSKMFITSWLSIICFFASFFSVSHGVCVEPAEGSLQYLLDSTLLRSGVPGISVAVYLKEQDTVITGFAGVSHDTVRIAPEMLWGIGSNTKTFAAVVCLKLMEQGKLDLDQKIEEILPPFPNVNSSITIRQLLQHQSGLADFFDNPDMFAAYVATPYKRWSPEECLRYVPKPIFKPGGGSYYSNTNYVLAGLIIERVAGMPFYCAVHKCITEPLGLTGTFVDGFDEVEGVRVHPWNKKEDISRVDRTSVNTSSWAAGCMLSTPSEMVRWYNALFLGDFLTAGTFREFTAFIPWDFDKYYDRVGLGIFELERNGSRYYAHGGGVTGYFSFTLHDQSTGNSIIAMATADFETARKLSFEIAELFRYQY